MPKHRIALLLLIVGSIGLLVLFLQLPKQPSSSLEKVKDMDPDSLKLQQAIELVNGTSPMEGITLLRELIQKDSSNIDAHYYLGLFSVKSGQLDKAIMRFDKVLSLAPDNIRYQVEVGYQFMVMDSAAKALRCFERGLQIDSTDNNSLFFSAQALERMDRLTEAKRNYEALLRHNNDSIVAAKVNEFIDIINKKLNP
jgi:tetratricopeptide (TPR) repeat protein